MDELTGEALRRAEAVAGDYHPHRGRAHRGVDAELLGRAARRARSRGDGGGRACAQLLEEIERGHRAGDPVAEGLAAVAVRVATALLEPGPPEPGHREPGHREPGHREPGHCEPGHREPRRAAPAPRALAHCLVRDGSDGRR